MTQNHGQPRSEPDLEPGADRFWGQVSQTRAGRSQADPEDDPATEEAGTGSEGADGEAPGTESGEPGHRHGHGEECLEWCPICRSAELIRTAVPPELRDQAEAFQREAVNIFRAFLTAYSERTGTPTTPDPPPSAEDPTPAPEESQVTDIPLD